MRRKGGRGRGEGEEERGERRKMEMEGISDGGRWGKGQWGELLKTKQTCSPTKLTFTWIGIINLHC